MSYKVFMAVLLVWILIHVNIFLTRDKILEAGADEFADVGFEGVRMDKIAKKTGVDKAAIYYNAGNKDALYALVLNELY